MLDRFLGIKWKIGAIGFGLSSIVLGVACGFLKVENNNLSSKNDELSGQITVLKIDLDQSRKNTTTLKKSLADQNDAVEQLGTESAKRMTTATDKLAEAAKMRFRVQRQADGLLHFTLNGSTLEQRVLEVDAKVLENLK